MNDLKPRSIRLIFDIPVFSGSKREVLDLAAKWLHSDSKSGVQTIFTPNPEQIVATTRFPWFLSLFSQSSLNLPDGEGLVWAMKRRDPDLVIDRISGREIFHELLGYASQENLKVFLLGGKPDSAKIVIDKYLKNNSKLEWKTDPGAKDIQHESPTEKQRVLNAITNYRPDLVFVAYGAPWQEKWISDHQAELTAAGVKIAMVVGGSFEYEAGKVPQVAPLVSQLKLEWLQRLIMEPTRLKRQLIGAQFFLWVLQGKS